MNALLVASALALALPPMHSDHARPPQLGRVNFQTSCKPAAEKVFERQADLEADKITVRAEGHKVILGGEVNSWNERSIAERAAWSAPGVSQLQDNIVVA